MGEVTNAHRPTEPYIGTITITRYMDVLATSEDAAEKLILREMTRQHGQDARLTKIQKG